MGEDEMSQDGHTPESKEGERATNTHHTNTKRALMVSKAGGGSQQKVCSLLLPHLLVKRTRGTCATIARKAHPERNGEITGERKLVTIRMGG